MAQSIEYCCECDEPTGKAGKGEDSLYTDDDNGPFCSECYDELEEDEYPQENSQFGVGA